MPEMRAAHPYYLYDAIHAQPVLVEKVLANRATIERAADAMAEKERITFVGIGTSLHAAQIAEQWLREFTARADLGAFRAILRACKSSDRVWSARCCRRDHPHRHNQRINRGIAYRALGGRAHDSHHW